MTSTPRTETTQPIRFESHLYALARAVQVNSGMHLDATFDFVAQQISPSDASFADGIERAERLGRILESDPAMEVAEIEVGGSCGKQTATAPLDDADLFVYLQPDSWRTLRGSPHVPATVLRHFENRVAHTYRTHLETGRVRLRRQSRSLRIEPLGARSVSVDIVPVRWDGDPERVVLIPDRETRSWRPTCIRRQLELLDELDIPNRAVRRAIRLLKVWRRQNSLCLRSYATEILVLHAVRRGVGRHPRSLFLAVLEYIVRTQLREPVIIDRYVTPSKVKRASVHIFDPAVDNNNVGDNIDSAGRARVVACARRTLTRLERAEDSLSRGRVGVAETAISDAFGVEIEISI